MIKLWSAIGAVGGVRPMLVNPSKTRGMFFFSFSYSWVLVPGFGCWRYCCWNGLRVKDFWCYSRLKVSLREASQSNSCFCLEEGWYFEEDNECFSRCRCCCQMLLGIHTPCARVLFSSLDVTSHLSLLDRVVGQVSQLSGGSVTCDLWHRHNVASLCVFFKIDRLVDHPVRGHFPAQYVLRRPTRGALAAHSRSFEMPRSRTVQFSRSFVLSCVRLWNGLHESVFAGEDIGAFKTSVNRSLFTRLTARCFFLLFNYFSFIFPFPET